jgi:uncharacterized protein YceK
MVLPATLAMLIACAGSARGSSFVTLYNFKGAEDGAQPNGLTLGKNGTVYGTTYTGGANRYGVNGGQLCGTLFELTPTTLAQWLKTVLYNFNGTDGMLPSPSGVNTPGPKLVFGDNGTLYGTTAAGGSGANPGGGLSGTVFQLTPAAIKGGAWTETVLYNFGGGDSYSRPHTPYGGAFIGPSGTIYGTTFSNALVSNVEAGGTVFAVHPPPAPGESWTEQTLISFYPFNGMGFNPLAGVIYSRGSLYGTTNLTFVYGGCGSVYELSPATSGSGTWVGTAIHNFVGGDGCRPVGVLTAAPNGILYGTTYWGGTGGLCQSPVGSGCGTVFQLAPPAAAGGTWTETVIYSFTAQNGDGAYPAADVVLGKNGVLYGTTTLGGSATSGSPCSYYGANGCGTVFQLTAPTTPGGTWTETILHSFTGQNGDGSTPGPLTSSPDGVLLGPTWTGGSFGQGTVFAVKP